MGTSCVRYWVWRGIEQLIVSMINTAIFNVKSVHCGVELVCRNRTTFKSFAWLVDDIRNSLSNVSADIRRG